MNQDTQPIGDDLNIYGDVKYILTLIDESIQSTSWLLNDGVHRIGRIQDYEILLDDITGNIPLDFYPRLSAINC